MLRITILLFFPCICYGQGADFLAVKKRGKTIRSYYTGTHINMKMKNGAYRNAQISAIRNDSIFLREYVVRQIPTTLGTFITDTAGSYRFAYHYKDIAALEPKERRGFNIKGSGAALTGGGMLLVLAGGVVYLADRDNFSPALMGAAAGLAGVGLLMSNTGSKGIIPGRKGITIDYIDMTP